MEITAHMTENEILKAAEEHFKACLKAYNEAPKFAVPATFEEYATFEGCVEFIRDAVERKKIAEKYAKEKYPEFLNRLEKANSLWEVDMIRRENSKELNERMKNYHDELRQGNITENELHRLGTEINCIGEGWNNALKLAERTYRKNHGLPEKKTGLVISDWESKMIADLESKTEKEIM